MLLPPFKHTVFEVSVVQNTGLKYRYKIIEDGVNKGWYPNDEITAALGYSGQTSIQNGLFLRWGTFDNVKLGQQINFAYYADATIADKIHIINTDKNSHLLKYNNGKIRVNYNVDTITPLDQNNTPAPGGNKEETIGLVKDSETCDITKVNNKSFLAGFGGKKSTTPKWIGFQQYKQWKQDFDENKIIVEDAELKISSEVPQLDDLIPLDTSNWYDSAGNKAGSAGAWTQTYWAGFAYGNPVPSKAFSNWLCLLTRNLFSFNFAPSPRLAVKRSLRIWS